MLLCSQTIILSLSEKANLSATRNGLLENRIARGEEGIVVLPVETGTIDRLCRETIAFPHRTVSLP